jgi:hypothetical protein
VHGQCGWASMISVDFSADRSIADATGHAAGTGPVRPGALSYFNRIRAPKATAATHVTPSKVVRKIFLRMDVTIASRAVAVIKQSPFHAADGLRAATGLPTVSSWLELDQMGFSGRSRRNIHPPPASRSFRLRPDKQDKLVLPSRRELHSVRRLVARNDAARS